jgi:hypothetical protein
LLGMPGVGWDDLDIEHDIPSYPVVVHWSRYMRLVELPASIDDLNRISSEQSAERSVGLHVSAIIQHILVTSGLAEQSDFTEADLGMFAVIGRLWEQMLADSMFKAPRYQRPGEIEKDGIFGSPDAVDCDSHRVMEFKVTWKSSNRAIESFFKYILQVKSYCHMLGLTECDLYVFYVCGNWKPPIPQIKAWRLTFTEAELRTNWNVMRENAREMK